MSMVDELKYFLGLQVNQNNEGITIPQSTYTLKLVERFGICSSNTTRMPLSTTLKLSKDEKSVEVDEKLYHGMIRSLLYLTTSRHDLYLIMGICEHYQSSPRESHLVAIKSIIKYVKGTVNYGIHYTTGTNQSLVRYCDVDLAENLDDEKSTMSGCFFLGKNLISLHNKKQNCTSLSTPEAEYITLRSYCTQLLWMKQMASDYDMSSYDPMLVKCDNKSFIDI